MKHAILQFLRDEQGATAIEYGLLAGLIAAVIAGTVTTLGTEIKTAFGNVCTAIKGSA
ncbi:Flp family type IVb pilin, partial [Ralstonia pseudosolanacearum]